MFVIISLTDNREIYKWVSITRVGWRFTLLWKTLALPYHFIRRRDFVQLNYFNQSIFFFNLSACAKPGKSAVMCLCVNGIDYHPPTPLFLRYFHSILEKFRQSGVFFPILFICTIININFWFFFHIIDSMLYF